MEVGWYLRFSEARTVEVLVDPKSLDQLEYILHIHTDWRLEASETPDGARLARFTRIDPPAAT